MKDMPKLEKSHTFFDSDLDYTGRVGIVRIVDILQASATAHADLLGVGMSDLMKEGHTWMLSAMSVCFDRWPKVMEPLRLATWPSGVRGKLVCKRDYTIESEKGEGLIRSTSDWIYVDVKNRKIDRLPPILMNLAPEEVAQAGVESIGKIPQVAMPVAEQEIIVRHADTDVNRHVNNVHYVEWIFEPLEEAFFAHRLFRLDISYRAEARYGDVVESLVEMSDDGRTTLHVLRRKADGVALVTALCRWE